MAKSGTSVERKFVSKLPNNSPRKPNKSKLYGKSISDQAAALSALMASRKHHVRWSPGPIEELSALLEREGHDGYGRMQNRFLGIEDETSIAHTHWRHMICDWYYEFIDQYDCDRDVAGVAMNYFDRYMFQQMTPILSRDRFQLVAIASLFIAIKAHSISEDEQAKAKALGMLYYGHRFSASDVEDMELEMLHTLQWKLNPPTMHQFARNYSMLHPQEKVCPRTHFYLHEATRYQVELALFDPRLLEQFKPSVLAYAAMLNASGEVDPSVLTPYTRDQWRSLMTHSDVKLDPSHVEKAQLALKELCPQIPGIDQFEPSRQDSSGQAPAARRGRAGSISPTNIADDI